jgi:hypothetical protein
MMGKTMGVCSVCFESVWVCWELIPVDSVISLVVFTLNWISHEISHEKSGTGWDRLGPVRVQISTP